MAEFTHTGLDHVAAAERLAGRVAEDKQRWDIRWPALKQTPAAAVRFVSAEPLLGPINMGLDAGQPAPDWLIIGGESGPGARPMAVERARDLLAQCQRPGVLTVPFVKQLGSVTGRELGAGPKGGDWDKWPEDLRFRGLSRRHRGGGGVVTSAQPQAPAATPGADLLLPGAGLDDQAAHLFTLARWCRNSARAELRSANWDAGEEAAFTQSFENLVDNGTTYKCVLAFLADADGADGRPTREQVLADLE